MPKQPWDVPPRPTDYDRDPEVLYAAIGSALSSWQYVENAIANIFEWLVVEGDPRVNYVDSMSPAERAYGSVVSFDGRAGMVTAAADAFFDVHKHPSFHTRLSKLMEACRGWSGRRNEIAHGQVGGSPVDLNLCALWPSEYSSRKRAVDYRARYVYNSAQIKEFGHRFLHLAETVRDFLSEFRAWRLKQLGLYPWRDDEPTPGWEETTHNDPPGF